MAQSRLEKIGTIFSRVTGLLRSGAMKPEDKPIWYDLYEAFPPKLEPRFDRPVPKIPIRNIFYEEDIPRAKFHKYLKQNEMVSLFDRKRETQTQQFIKIYQGLRTQGALDEQKVFETSVELLQQERQQMRTDHNEEIIECVENIENHKFSLSEAYKEAMVSSGNSVQKKTQETSEKVKIENSIGNIDIKNLFRD